MQGESGRPLGSAAHRSGDRSRGPGVPGSAETRYASARFQAPRSVRARSSTVMTSYFRDSPYRRSYTTMAMSVRPSLKWPANSTHRLARRISVHWTDALTTRSRARWPSTGVNEISPASMENPHAGYRASQWSPLRPRQEPRVEAVTSSHPVRWFTQILPYGHRMTLPRTLASGDDRPARYRSPFPASPDRRSTLTCSTKHS